MKRVTVRRGKTHVITGPMYSGKTSYVFEVLKTNLFGRKKVLMIKYSKDTRYNGNGKRNWAKSHDGFGMPAILVESFIAGEDPIELLDNPDVIGIDEGQFMDGIADFCERCNSCGIDVYVACLMTDYNLVHWPNTQSLTRRYGVYKQMYAVCIRCGDDEATCSKRVDIEPTTSTMVASECIGGDELYISTCFPCHSLEVTEEMKKKRQEIIQSIKTWHL